MHRSYHKWFSPSLNREMELLVFGHAGARVLVFPTSMGKYYEYEDRGMVNTLGEHLERGWIQLYCVDSVDAESWYARWAHPSAQLARHVQYKQYLLNEVQPFSKSLNDNSFLMTHGCSFGAFHAINFAFRHPAVVDRCIGLSGLYDMRSFMGGYSGEDLYFQNPVDYMANVHAPDQLRAFRHMDIIFVAGQSDPALPSNQRLSTILWQRDAHLPPIALHKPFPRLPTAHPTSRTVTTPRWHLLPTGPQHRVPQPERLFLTNIGHVDHV